MPKIFRWFLIVFLNREFAGWRCGSGYFWTALWLVGLRVWGVGLESSSMCKGCSPLGCLGIQGALGLGLGSGLGKAPKICRCMSYPSSSRSC
jgi:hypothetical protein